MATRPSTLLVANGGSDTISLLGVEPESLRLADVVPSGGGTPTSVAVHGSLVSAANNADANVTGVVQDQRRQARRARGIDTAAR